MSPLFPQNENYYESTNSNINYDASGELSRSSHSQNYHSSYIPEPVNPIRNSNSIANPHISKTEPSID
jgi:hypothetical protein